jgi:hypothetical protein
MGSRNRNPRSLERAERRRERRDSRRRLLAELQRERVAEWAERPPHEQFARHPVNSLV